MPLVQSYPRWALATLADMTEWAGKTLYTRGAHAISLAGTSHKYVDVLVALCGGGTGAFKSALELAGLNSVTVGINSDDRVWVESTSEFEILSGYGFGPTFGFTQTQSSVESSPGRFRVTADADWKRGPVQPSDGVRVDWGTPSNALLSVHAQDVPTALRLDATWSTRGLGGGDAVVGLGSRHVSWTLDKDGHVVESVLNDDNLASWTEDGISLRTALGFSGNEEILASPISGGAYRRATHPCRWLLVPSRPLDSQTLSASTIGSGGLLIGGGSVSTIVSSHKTWSFSGWLDGPVDALGGDLAYHFIHGLSRYLVGGARVRVYQNWGESRLSGRSYLGDSYSVDRTIENEGYRGVIDGCLSPDSDSKWSVEWPEKIRRRSPIRFSVVEG